MRKEDPESFLSTFDGEKLHYRTFQSAHNKPILLGLHGLNGHSGLYWDLARVVQKAGLAFWMFDLRGHGHSGKRGEAPGWEALIADALTVLQRAEGQNQVVGIFGHSFGGLLSFYLAHALGASAPPLFLSSPCFKLRNQPKWKQAFSKFAPEPLSSRIKVPLGIKPEEATDSPEAQQSHATDPLRPRWITLRYGAGFLDAVNPQRISSIAKQFQSQVEILAGGKDELVDSAFTDLLCREVFPAHQVRLTLEREAAHEVFFSEMEKRKKPLKIFSNWLKELS